MPRTDMLRRVPAAVRALAVVLKNGGGARLQSLDLSSNLITAAPAAELAGSRSSHAAASVTGSERFLTCNLVLSGRSEAVHVRH